MSRVTTLFGFAAIATTMIVSACEPDLGGCDAAAMANATQVYYLDGVPYYAGQAVVHQSCTGSFCHAAAAKDAARKGAPHGLNFDVTPLLATASEHDVAVLKAGLHRIRDEAPELFGAVDEGEMPPGKAGERPALAWMSSGASAATLPSIKSKAGKLLLKNWLACDAPVVAYTTGAPGTELRLGDTMATVETKVDRTFASIYGAVLGGGCATCHTSAAGNPYAGKQALDFSSADAAFASLNDKPAFAGGMCKAATNKLVVPGDCQSSLLYQKLLPKGQVPDLCGDPMPLVGTPVSQSVLDAVCMWIDAGATR